MRKQAVKLVIFTKKKKKKMELSKLSWSVGAREELPAMGKQRWPNLCDFWLKKVAGGGTGLLGRGPKTSLGISFPQNLHSRSTAFISEKEQLTAVSDFLSSRAFLLRRAFL